VVSGGGGGGAGVVWFRGLVGGGSIIGVTQKPKDA